MRIVLERTGSGSHDEVSEGLGSSLAALLYIASSELHETHGSDEHLAEMNMGDGKLTSPSKSGRAVLPLDI